MHTTEIEVTAAGSLSEATALLGSRTGAAAIAGGTDLVPRWKQGLVHPSLLVNVNALAGLDTVEESEGGLRIGAGVTLDRLSEAAAVRQLAPALVEAARAVGSPQIRQVATVGGNLCQDVRCWYLNQSRFWQSGRTPCFKRAGERCYVAPKSTGCRALYMGDLAPVLAALEARAVLVGPAGERAVAVPELFANDGLRWLDLRPGELITHVKIPGAGNARASYYRKLRRSVIDFAVLGVAAVVDREGDICRRAAAALTAVGSAPLLLPHIADWLSGSTWSGEKVAEASAAAAKELSLLPHMGVTGSYKRAVAGPLLENSLLEAWRRARLASGQ